MFNEKTICQTDSFGFDFSSVYAQRAPSSDPAEHGNHLSYSSNVAVLHGDYEPSIDEMVDELSSATEKALDAIAETEEDDDGMTAAEVLACGRKVKREPRVSRSKAALQEQEDTLSIERILEQVLEHAQLAVSRGIVWGADLDDQIWKPLQTEVQISNFLHGLGIRRYGNALKWFSSRVAGDPAFRAPGFFETTNLWGRVSFADGLLDVRSGTFSDRALSDRVTATLRWNYGDIANLAYNERFQEAMRSLAVTESAYLRLQELCGVALHAKPSGHILYFQHRNPRIASIFTTLLARSWSEESVSFLGLRDHEKSFRTAQVLEHPVVISAKEGDVMLRDISTILALVDGDGVNVDRKHQDPFDFISQCIMICAGKNLPVLSKGGMETLRYYLVRSNLSGELPDGFNTWDVVHYTKEFLAWSLEGLRRFISTRGKFTYDEESDIPREDASIVDFVRDTIIGDPNGKIPTAALQEAYANFCSQNNLTALSKERLLSYLRETFNIESRAVRAPWFKGGKTAFGYVGIRFSEEYLRSLEESYDDEGNSDAYLQNSEDPDEEGFYSSNEDCWEPDFEPCGELPI